jgi:AcrR family transcriptional regulator
MTAVNAERRLSKRERAEQTRARIIDAAYRLFSQHGYEATTMQAVADEAGVAVQTVYFTFHTKGGLLTAIEGLAAGGGEEGHDLRERRQHELLEERDARKVVALWVAATAAVLKRITSFVALLGASLQMDANSVERRGRERDRWFQLLIDRLVALDALKPELAPSRSLDVARALVSLEAYQEMTQRWGWSEQEWIEWMTGVVVRELLDGRPAANTESVRTKKAGA